MSFQIGIAVLTLVCFKLCNGFHMKSPEKSFRICGELALDPSFDIDLIVGKPWRIYYTWNLDLEDKCMNLVIKQATTTILDRIYNDMHEYLQVQPRWDQAAVLMIVGPFKREVLMFAKEGAPGSFSAVPNIIRSGNVTLTRKAIPSMNFFMKLLDHKYLLMVQCDTGVASLSSRKRPPYRSEIDKTAKKLNLGKGLHACLADSKNRDLFFPE